VTDATEPTTIKGSVEKFFVRKPNGWGVALVKTSAAESGWLRVAGVWPEGVVESTFVEMLGEYETHHKFGKQLKLHAVVGELNSDEVAVTKWLAHRLKHVGPERAKALAALGPSLWHALENDPSVLRAVKGLTDDRIEELHASYRAHWSEREIVLQLIEIGYIPKLSGMLFALYRGQVFERLEQNPYLPFSELREPFEDVDKVALKHWKVAKDDPRRVGVVAVLLLRRALNDGDCYVLEHTLTHALATELKLTQGQARQALQGTNAIVARGKYLLLEEIDEAERIIAAKIRGLMPAGAT